MEQHSFFELIDKYLAGKATREEQSLLEEYYKRLDKNNQSTLTPEQEQALRQLMLQNIRREIHHIPSITPVKRINYFTRYAAAAVVLIAFGISAYLYFGAAKPETVASVKKDIAPGGNKAVLTLGNGRQITLEGAKNGDLAQQGATTVHKTDNSLVAYQVDKSDNDAVANEFNTITTPRGGQYQVILPDGTHAWLNAASSIRFPVTFSGKVRNVETTGEVYFEVAKDAHKPFNVISAGQTITVLGTHFNIMAYPEESSVITTLLEGSVKITKNNVSKILKPGEQALVNQDIKIMPADVDDAVAWKNGITSFNDADIKSIMRKVSRWYDVDVEYQGQISSRLFTGSISRKSNLSGLLKILALNHIQFSVEGKRLIVKQ
ncbi:FecR family protein [Mucilaginibacter lappiensis]|uniref:FecR family protein n=1 Tax=Mucilaginibacter lappiensis TaxID=354630 RepID=A0ABR6PH80_9SPHI|nr:FecR family protein [Mucilaginibacter lappiensis]MBB6109120.1 hypothetical protein [Mucilaginibacter lappiensis]SIQ76406.1 FecR family protein [Mucilaginibacter lappiensis]